MTDKIKEKIRKALALSASSNPNEAATALAKARELMEKYNISEDEILEAQIGETWRQRGRKKLLRYEAMLAQIIADVFACHPLFGGDAVVFIGQLPNNEIAGYAWDVLHKRQAKARKDYLSTVSYRFKPTNRTAKADLYAEGWAEGVYIACSHLPHIAPPAAVQAYIQRKYKVQQKRAKAASGNTSHGDHLAGYDAGRKERIHAGVDHQPTHPARNVGEGQLKLF